MLALDHTTLVLCHCTNYGRDPLAHLSHDNRKKWCTTRVLPALQAALSRGLLPDDETLRQLMLDPELPLSGRDISTLRWPEEPLRYVLTSRWTTLMSTLSGRVTLMAC